MRTKDHRKEILLHENAIRITSRYGLDGLSMQKLATATRISAATIYVYFKNREDLLSKVYNRLEQEYDKAAMSGFNELMPLQEGLWLQWRNRYHYICAQPEHFRFLEQFRNYPLVELQDAKGNNTKAIMAIFFQNAIRKKELAALPTEMLMASLFGPLYYIIKVSREEKTLNGSEFALTERRLKILLDATLNGLRPVS